MALSGSVSTNKYSTSSHGTIGLILSWTASQSIVNNSTTISWTLKSNGTMSSGYYVQAGPVTVKIAGTTVLNTTSRFSMHGGGGYSKSGTITVPHNEDGTKSVSMSVRAAIYSASVNCTGSKSFALNNITRYALLDSVSDFDDEVGNVGHPYPTISYSNPAGTDLVTGVKIRISWDEGNDYTTWHDLDDGGADSPYTFDSSTLTSGDIDRMLQFCTASNTLAVKFELQSTLGGVNYTHSKDAVMTIVNADPTAGTASFSEEDATVSAITGGGTYIVQNQSTLRIETTSSTGNKYASIVSYVLNFNGNDYDITNDLYYDFVKPNYSGTFTGTVTTTDSRGNTATDTVSVTITPWQAPSADCSAERVNGFETNTTLTVDGTISSITGSSMTIQEKHSDDGGQTWIGPNPVSDNTPTTIALNNQKDWTIVVLVSDAFDTQTYTLTIGKGIPNIAIGKNWSCLGINGYPTKDGELFIGGTARLKPNDTDAGVELPHAYSTTEQIVGYWIDGSPIYELTIEMGSYTSISSNGNITISSSLWNETAIPVNVVLINANGASGSNKRNVWICEIAEIDVVTGEMRIFNTRSSTMGFDTIVIQYVKVT